MKKNMQHGFLHVIILKIIRFFQASLAAGGTFQIFLMREYWAVNVSLTGTNGRDGEDSKRPGMCGGLLN